MHIGLRHLRPSQTGKVQEQAVSLCTQNHAQTVDNRTKSDLASPVRKVSPRLGITSQHRLTVTSLVIIENPLSRI